MKYYKNLLTIGIPAYNEAKYLRKTLESCVEQAGCVIISNNASSDETQQICEEFAQKYPNIKYIRQEKNIGGSENFMACLDAAQTKYFMWFGGHDYLDADYTKHMLHTLENSDAVGCWPASRAVDKDDNEIGIFDCWFADRLTSDIPAQRVYTLIAHLHECVGLFGIYKTEIAKLAQHNGAYIIGGDHVYLCEMAKHGRIIYCPRSVYNWRQTKLDFNDEEHRKAWEKSLGNAENVTKNSRKEMRDKQLEILKSTKLHGGLPALITKMKLVCKAKKKLKKRFGDD
jgi:glycosyltransferase involved in cell wall biosynthesis